MAAVLFTGWMTSAAAAPLVLAVSRTPLSAPLLVADALRLFEAEGVEVRVDEYVGGYRCLDAVVAGEADGGTVAALPLVFRSFKASDFAVVATFVRSRQDSKLLTRATLGIERVADLRGRRVGAVTGTSSHFFLHNVLVLAGVDPESVQVVHGAPDRLGAALLGGEVDAVALWEPHAWELMREPGAGVRSLPFVSTFRETFNLAVGRQALEAAGDRLDAVLRALDRAILYIEEQPEAARAIVARRLALPAAFADSVWTTLDFRLSLDQALLVNLEQQARWVIEEGLVDATEVPNYLGVVDSAPLRRVRPDAATLIQ